MFFFRFTTECHDCVVHNTSGNSVYLPLTSLKDVDLRDQGYEKKEKADHYYTQHLLVSLVKEMNYSGTPLMRPPLGHKILVVITRWSH